MSFADRSSFLERLGDRPCPVCGAVRFSWGEMQAQHLRFIEPDAGFMERSFSLAFRMTARRCEECGNVQIFDAAPRESPEG